MHLKVCQTERTNFKQQGITIVSVYHYTFQIIISMKVILWQSFNMSSFIAGLDEAEAFGDTELMAEFSLLSVVQNLQQGKMATDLLETLEVKHQFRLFFLSLTHVSVAF